MEPVSAIVGLATTIMNKIWGNKDDKLKRDFLLQFQKEIATLELTKAQISINQAEAANPNRTWITWRELLGYALVSVVIYSKILFPIIALLADMAGHPLNLRNIPDVDLLDTLYLLCGMLGLDLAPSVIGKINSMRKK